MSGGPPSTGGPPVRYVHDDGRDPWWQSRSASVGAAVVLVLAILAVVAVVATRDDGSGSAVAMSLANTRATVDNALAPVRRAAKLKPLRKAGRNARAQVPALDDADVDLTNTKNRDLAGPAATLVASERAFLKALGGLNRVTDRRVRETDQGTWKQVRARIGDAAEDLVAASAAVSALDLDGPSGGLGFSTVELNRTLEPVDAMIANAHTRIERWRRERAKYRADLEEARRLSIPTIEYRDDVLAALNGYGRDRQEVDSWASRAAGYRRSDARRLHTQVSGFSSARDLTVNELSNALESAPRNLPQSVRRAHKAFGLALRESFEGLSNADTAISEFEFDRLHRYDDVTEVSEWQAFQSFSERAGERIGRLRARWLSSVQGAIGRIQSKVGPKPRYPSL